MQKRVARGESGPLVSASAGNFGQALAYACRKHGISLAIYASLNANPLKVSRMRALGAEVRLEGIDFDAAKQAAKNWAMSAGATLVEDGRDVEISEGAGSVAVELFADGGTFDAVLVPLGNGALLTGMARWIKSVSPATQVIGVCSRGANAMQASWRNGPGAAVVTHSSADTIADGIAVRMPIPEAVADMRGIVDDVIAVDDTEIVQAMRVLHSQAGLVVEPAGAAGLAAVGNRFAGARIATVLCGSNLTTTQMQEWLLAPVEHRDSEPKVDLKIPTSKEQP